MAAAPASCSRGIVIQLSAEAAESLRSSRPQRSVVSGRGGSWDDVIPLQPRSQQEQEPIGSDGSIGDEAKSSSSSTVDDGESTLSGAPPPTVPVVLVDLKRLVGFAPQTDEEASQIAEQLRAALHSDDDGDNFERRAAELFESRLARHSTITATDDKDCGSRLCAAIQYPAALPCDSLATGPPARTEILWKRLLRSHPVPAVRRVLDRLRDCDRPLTWKVAMRKEIARLARSEERRREYRAWTREGRRRDALENLYRVRDALEHQVAQAEEKLQVMRDAREVEVQRVLALQREQGGSGGLGGFDLESTLFSFPQTFGGLAEEPLYPEDADEEEENPDSLVSDYSSDESDDVSQTEDGSDVDKAFPASSRLGGGAACDGEAGGPRIVVDNRDLSATEPADESTANDDPPLGGRRNRSRCRGGKQAARAHRERWQDAAREADHAAQYAEARKAEEAVREACTDPALRATEAVAVALEKRLQQVDDLLETLQDEEWQAEEGSGSEDDSSSDKGAQPENCRDSRDKMTTPPSVLDEILAMILGATTVPLDEADDVGESTPSAEEAAARRRDWLRTEHRTIVAEWKEHFGRVPPPLVREEGQPRPSGSAPSSEENAAARVREPRSDDDDDDWRTGSSAGRSGDPEVLRSSLGLPARVVDDWEEAADDDDVTDEGRAPPGPATPSPPPRGLRPGGRVP